MIGNLESRRGEGSRVRLVAVLADRRVGLLKCREDGAGSVGDTFIRSGCDVLRAGSSLPRASAVLNILAQAHYIGLKDREELLLFADSGTIDSCRLLLAERIPSLGAADDRGRDAFDSESELL